MSVFQQAYIVHKPVSAQAALQAAQAAMEGSIERQRSWMFGCIRNAANNGNTSTILQDSIYPANKDILVGYGYLISPYGDGWLKVSWSSDKA